MLKAKGCAPSRSRARTTRTSASARWRARTGEIDVLIGTTIVDVGVDVPSIGMVILAGGGKAEIQLRQRIGRGLRAKKNGPNVTFIVDFTDDAQLDLRDHARSARDRRADARLCGRHPPAGRRIFPGSNFHSAKQREIAICSDMRKRKRPLRSDGRKGPPAVLL
jgi:superfamily II DNA or RNA helicase